MSVPVWPTTIPDTLLVSGYSQAAADTSLRSATDAGPGKVRRRFTAGVEQVAGNQVMTKTELGYLRTFYTTTLLGGALRFAWKDPITEAAVEMRFTEPISWTSFGGDNFQVALSLEILP